jgi:dephospho-CoA kinase
MLYTIGLTGGVASGKSYAAQLFAELGVPVLEADVVARIVVEPGTPGLAAIVAHYGSTVLQSDGALNRRALREIIFNDTAARRDLEQITHPLIRQYVNQWRATQSTPYCVYAAAILIEAGFDQTVDRVLVIDTPEAVQLRRVQARDGIDAALARQMIAAQATRQRRLSCADDVIDNKDEAQDLRTQLLRLHKYYCRLGHAAFEG